MSKTIKFTRHIDPTERGRYLRIPFTVPKNVESLTISYDYQKAQLTTTDDGTTITEINTIDLGLYSTNGYLGESGSNRQCITISNRASAPGYSNDTMASGTWYVMAGAYRVQKGGVNVHYTVTFDFKSLRLFWGETHSHTTGSDGKKTYEQLITEAAQLKLDYLVVTDHNDFAQNLLITGQEPITVLPGSEWTHYKGHANFIGAKRPFSDPYIVQTQNDMKQLFKEVAQNGALIVVNHSFDRNCGWHFDLDNTPFDLLEIWNGAVLPDDNHLAYDWWQHQLNAGKIVRVTGGSDYHKTVAFRHIGQPAVGVWSDSNTPTEILKNMRAGHITLGYDCKAPTMLLRNDKGIQGDIVSPSNEAEAILTKVKANDELKIITDKRTETIQFKQNYTIFHHSIKTEGAKYCRLELFRQPFSEMLKMPIVLTNALFFTA